MPTPPSNGSQDHPATPDRELELANAGWAVGDFDGIVAHLSAAIRLLNAAGDNRRAAMTCAQLGGVYSNFMGNLTAGRAWFARAVRLVADEPPCIEQGWVAVAPMGCDVDDPHVLLARTALALDRARRFGDLNLETKALADGGLARVRLGRIEEGMALLDEAMALVCGPADDADTAMRSVCSFFTACYAIADFDRAGSWSPVLDRHGLMGPRPGGAVFLRSHCESLRATLLCELGRWGEAEAVLTRSMAEFEALNRSPSWHPAIALADLRIRQGRLAEAEALLLGRDAWLEGLLPAARLHLARGEYELAVAAATRGMRAIGEDRMRAAELSAVLVEARLALGDLAGASAAADEMDQRLVGVDLPVLRARGLGVRARLCVGRDELDGAIELLREALDSLDDADAPWLRGLLLLELAECRDQVGDRSGAAVDARMAAGLLGALDVVLSPRHGDVLSRLAPARRADRSTTPPVTLSRATRGWLARHGATQVTLTDSKGLRYLAELLARPGVEQHALDLVDRVEGVSTGAGGPDRRSLGTAGDMLDSRARATYRCRIEGLRAEVDEAIALENLDRAEALQGELDELVRELGRAFGLGGRSRQVASAVERARLNVTRALRTAVSRLTESLPEAGAALDRHLRTGTYCVYAAPGDDDIRWIVQSGVNGPRTN